MRRTRSSIAAALFLILLGGWFLAVQVSPVVKDFAYGQNTWPLPIIGIGGLLLVLGLVTWTPGLFIPAAIVSGIGGILYYQLLAGDFTSWSYAWALIPGFVGVGILLTGVAEQRWNALRGGGWLILISLVLFAIFGSFLGGSELLLKYWPVLLIVVGLVILAQTFIRRR